MASLDFEYEKTAFRQFYEQNYSILNDATNSFITLINALTTNKELSVSKTEGRVKDKEECIKKFSRKYRTQLEEKEYAYEIKEYITDLIGLRIVCLYEDDIEKVSSLLREHFEVIDVTDKISEIESTEDSFGYKGLHLDLKLNENRKNLPEYSLYSTFNFEIQIRTIIQDSWSVLDHKIKYKKSIPNHLKRRINVLAALFELADREFREIRESTKAEIEKVTDVITEDEKVVGPKSLDEEKVINSELNAFNFLKIGNHFYNDYEFEAYKVDGFVHEIQNLSKGITRSVFHNYVNKNISKVKLYQQHFEATNSTDKFNPYTVFRHCLYLANNELFERILTNAARESFEKWIESEKNKKPIIE